MDGCFSAQAKADTFAPRAPRQDVMLAATIETAGHTVPVRIRNISVTGAMIEADRLPAAGERLVLRRLDLHVGVEAVWVKPGRCGVVFDKPVDIDEWVAGTYLSGKGASAAQLRIDQIVSAVRSEASELAQDVQPAHRAPQTAPTIRPSGEGDQLIAKELLHVRQMLDSVTAALSEDIDVLLRHEKALQNCDIAGAILELLAKVIAAEDREAAIAQVEMHEVRTRLSGKQTLI